MSIEKRTPLKQIGWWKKHFGRKALGQKYIAFCVLPLAMAACGEGVTVSDAYIRGLPPGQTVTAAFMTLTNNAGHACRLVGASSPIASKAELHAHFHENGRMSMRPVDELVVEAGESVSLKPGGYHLMLFGLQGQLKEGDKYGLTLLFKGCPELELKVPVRSVLHENHH